MDQKPKKVDAKYFKNSTQKTNSPGKNETMGRGCKKHPPRDMMVPCRTRRTSTITREGLER